MLGFPDLLKSQILCVVFISKRWDKSNTFGTETIREEDATQACANAKKAQRPC